MLQLERFSIGIQLGTVLVVSMVFWLGCGEFDSDLATDSEQAVSQQELRGCDTHKEDAYRSGNRIGTITVVELDGELVEINTAGAYQDMKKAAARDGVHLDIVSGFRTMAEQDYLYGCYLSGACNGGNLAAAPGYSNHQNGHALDLNSSARGVYGWLRSNAARFGFSETVPGEPWHWEYWGGKNTPGDCKTRPKARYNMQFDVKLAPNRNDKLKQGRSEGVTDVFVGDEFNGSIFLKNGSNRKLKDVRVRYDFSKNYLRAKKYTIYKKARGDGSWKRVDWLHRDKRNPNRRGPSASARIYLGHLQPGERRKVVFEFKARRYSLHKKKHVRLRAWVGRIKNVYSKTKRYKGKPNRNKFSRIKRDRAAVDILSRAGWRFDGRKHRDIEGWRNGCNRQHAKPLSIKDVGERAGALRVHITGKKQCIVSPDWTRIQANQFDEMVLPVTSRQGAHDVAVWWKRNPSQSWDSSRKVVFETTGDGENDRMIVPLGEHPKWSGDITQIRIDLLENTWPDGGEERHLVNKIFFQSSRNGKTSMKKQNYANGRDVQL